MIVKNILLNEFNRNRKLNNQQAFHKKELNRGKDE